MLETQSINIMVDNYFTRHLNIESLNNCQCQRINYWLSFRILQFCVRYICHGCSQKSDKLYGHREGVYKVYRDRLKGGRNLEIFFLTLYIVKFMLFILNSCFISNFQQLCFAFRMLVFRKLFENVQHIVLFRIRTCSNIKTL